MDEYISKQDALKGQKTGTFANRIRLVAEPCVPVDYIESIEPADVVQVRYGKWTHKPDVYGVVYCSECDYELHTNSTSYCPNCGAKMDRSEQNGRSKS